jgi:SNF2 family DNA or RNA helicase
VALLKGTPNQRSATIEAFQQPELAPGQPRVLLLNLRDESAAGANLTAASHCVFLHPLLVNSQQEFDSCDTQAVGRVRRYGQARTVQIYRFVVDNTIDTDIFRARRADAAPMLEAACRAEEVAPLP